MHRVSRRLGKHKGNAKLYACRAIKKSVKRYFKVETKAEKEDSGDFIRNQKLPAGESLNEMETREKVRG